ncbi:tandem-95 repeat protein [Rubritalea halochordaticola]|uniref:tandem-95 repeat protein n=1 Tax=Rubritalea halochordaticola TaxID=714537 RepID=UPI0031FC61A5
MLSKNSPNLNSGRIEGDVAVIDPENVNVNAGHTIQGTLHVPGNPTINGSTQIIQGSGSTEPSSHTIGIHNKSTVDTVEVKTEVRVLPVVTQPADSSGTVDAVLSAGDSLGDPAQLRDLVLQSGYGSLSLPAGNYGDITIKKDSTLVLGVAGQVSEYVFTSLTLQKGACLEVLGTVQITLRKDLHLNGAVAGDESHPEWLTLSLVGGNAHLNAKSTFYGHIDAAHGNVHLNASSQLIGSVRTEMFSINGRSLLRYAPREIVVVNQAPSANSASYEVVEDASIQLELTGVDPEGQPLTYTITAQPQHGTLSGTAPLLTYTPAAGYAGSDQISFVVSDGVNTSATAVIDLNVLPVNDAPTAESKVYSLDEDTSVNVLLAGSDQEGEALSYTVLSQPLHGQVTGTAPNLVYTPDADFFGQDSFTYKVNDGELDSEIATIDLTVDAVNDQPVANAQSLPTAEDQNLTIQLTGSDVEGDALSYTIKTQPLSGFLSGVGADWVYTPNPDYHGDDSFTFVVNDGSLESEEVQVSITVTPVNDAPVATNASLQLAEDGSVVVTFTGSDVDGDSLSYVPSQPLNGALVDDNGSWVYTPNANFHGEDSISFQVTDPSGENASGVISLTVIPVNDDPVASSETFSLNEDTSLQLVFQATDVDGDSLTYTPAQPQHGTLVNNAGNWVYTPQANYHGTDSISFTVADGSGGTDTGTLTLTVLPVNDAPVAVAQSVQVNEDESLLIDQLGTDLDGDALTFTASSPAHGTLTVQAGQWLYVPAADYHGADSFSFTVNDGNGGQSSAQVTITVVPVNDDPVAQAQSVETAEDNAVLITLNATDVDGDALSYQVNQPANGTLTQQGENWLYTPNENFYGEDVFTFTVTDSNGGSSAAQVNLTVQAVNDAPVATNLELELNEDNTLLVQVAGTDPDGDTLTYAVSNPTNGTLVEQNGQWLYTPATDFHGQDSFTFTVTDPAGEMSTGTVSITVLSVNDAPLVSDLALVVAEGGIASIPLQGSDVDGDALSFELVDTPSKGVVSANEDGTFSYAPNHGEGGQDTFTYRAYDGSAYSAPAVVTVSIDAAMTVAITSPVSGVSASPEQLLQVQLLARDPDSKVLLVELLVNGEKYAQIKSAEGFVTWQPLESGEYTLTARALNDRGESVLSEAVQVTVAGDNRAPVVSAGSDQNIQASLATTSNLIVNGSGEAEPVDGFLPGWTVVDGEWIRGDAGTDASLPAAKDGAYFLTSPTPTRCEIYQDIPVGQWRDAIDAQEQVFLFQGYARVKAELDRLDLPRLVFEFKDDQGVVLGQEEIASEPASGYWKLLLQDLKPPVGTDSIRVRVIADYNAINANDIYNDEDLTNDVYFDSLQLKAAEPVRRQLNGSFKDDGQPQPERAVVQWVQLTGSPAKIVTPDQLTSELILPGVGAYTFRLTVSDGELTGADEVTVAVTGVGGNMPPLVDAGDALSGDLEQQPVQLNGSVQDDGLPTTSSLDTRWVKVSGPGAVLFDDETSPTSGVSFQIPGTYRLRLQASDGEYTASDDLEVHVTCVGERQPLDVLVSVDWTRSMGAIEDVTSTRVKALEAAQLFTQALDPAKDNFEIIDMNATTYFGGYASSVQRGLADAWDRLNEKLPVRPEAKRAIVIICDGYFIDEGAINTNKIAQAKADGVEIYILAIDNNGYHPIYVERMKELASSPLHYYELKTSDEVLLAMKNLLNGQCGSINRAPEVYAGEARYIPELGESITLNASYLDDGQPLHGQPSFEWSVVSGDPQGLQISDPTSLSPVVTALQNGKYVLKLNVSDGALAGQDSLHIRVDTPCEGSAPHGLTAWWPFEYSTRDEIHGYKFYGPAVYADSSTYVEGATGFAREFNGDEFGTLYASNEQIPEFHSEEGFTIELRAKLKDNTDLSHAGTVFMFGKFEDQTVIGGNKDFLISYLQFILGTNGKASLHYRTVSYSSSLSISSNNSADEGYIDFVVVYDKGGSKLSVYANGKLANSVNGVELPDIDEVTDRLYLGGKAIMGNNFTGYVDDFALYNRPLSDVEVSKLFTQPLSKRCLPNTNLAPVVDAGPDRMVSATNLSVAMQGYVTDDSDSVNISWRTVTGPAEAVFADAGKLDSLVSFPEPGLYTLELSARDAFTESRDVLEVRVATQCKAALPADATLWVTGNGSLRDKVTGKFGSWASESLYPEGKVSLSLGFAGENNYAYFEDVVGGGSAFTMEGWFYIDPNASLSTRNHVFTLFDRANGEFVATLKTSSDKRYWYFSFDDPDSTSSSDVFNLPITPGNNLYITGWNHVSLSIDAQSQQAKCFFNGVQGNVSGDTTQLSKFALPSNYDVYVGGEVISSYPSFLGQIDELTLYNRALDNAEVSSIYAAGDYGKCAPSVNLAPVVNAGKDFVLSTLSGSVQPTASATDDVAVTYSQWTQITGPGTASFSDANEVNPTISFSAEGTYILQLEVSDGEYLVSDTMRVDVGHLCEYVLPSGAALWLRGDSNTNDLIGGAPTQWLAPESYTSGLVGNAFHFDSTRGGVQVSGLSDVANEDQFSLEMWYRVDEDPGTKDRHLVSWYDPTSRQLELGVLLRGSRYIYLDYKDAAGNRGWIGFADASSLLVQGGWNHLALNIDEVGNTASIYINGQLLSSSTFNMDSVVSSSSVLQLGGSSALRNYYVSLSPFVGAIDEFTMYRRNLSAQEIADIYAAGGHGKCFDQGNLPPVVSVQDVLTLAAPDVQGSLAAQADDEDLGSLTVVWSQKFGTGNLIFDNPTSLTTNVSADHSGLYTAQVKVSDGVYCAVAEVSITIGNPACTVPGPYAWWTGESLVDETRKFTLLDSSNSYSIVPAVNGNGIQMPSTRISVDSNVDFNPVGANGFAFEFWMTEAIYGSSNADYVRIGNNRIYPWYSSLRGTLGGYNFTDSNFKSGSSRADGYEHVAFSYNSASSVLSIYRNGALTNSFTTTGFDPATFHGAFSLGGLWPAPVLDDLTFYSEPLSAAQVQEIYSMAGQGKCVSEIPMFSENRAPEVNVREVYTMKVGDSPLTLAALATDDGRPFSGSLGYLWTQLEGPSSVVVSDSTLLNPALSFTEAGNYTFQLAVSDGEVTTESDLVRIRVLTQNNNAAPTVDAGEDTLVLIDESLQLQGSANDDGLPTGTLSYQWTQVDGPSTVTIVNTDTLTPTVTPLAGGNYVFQLAVSDGELTSFDRVAIAAQAVVNTPPVVDAGADFSVRLPSGTIVLNGLATDDGLPEGAELTSEWFMSSGPVPPVLNNLGNGAAEVQFSVAGEYHFVFKAYDGLYYVEDTLVVTVLESLELNQAPIVDLGADRVLDTLSTTIQPVLTDDGLPTNSYQYQWRVLSGPGYVDIQSVDETPTRSFLFSAPGEYVIELTADDGEYISRDEVKVTLPDSLFPDPNELPSVALALEYVVVQPETSVTLDTVVNDDDLSQVTYQWVQLSGPAALTISDATVADPTLTMPVAGDYVLQLSVMDGGQTLRFQTTARLLPPGNGPPVVDAGVDQTGNAFDLITLTATSAQEGLSYHWQQVAGPVGVTADIANPNSATTSVQTGVAGNYLFTVTVSDGVYTASDSVLVQILGVPFVEVTAPQSGQEVTDGGLVAYAANAYQDGSSIQSLAFYEGAEWLGNATRISGSITWVLERQALPAGSHTVTAVATLADGSQVSSDAVSYSIVDFDEVQLVLEINDPIDEQVISSQYPVTGTAYSDYLSYWSLDLRKDGETEWKSVYTSSSKVLDGQLALFDPSLLENGIYDLRLSGQTTVGLFATSSPVRVIVEGNLKVGHFALAFEDLSVALPGVPLSVTRTYDSRDHSQGDFGPGWQLGLKGVEVFKTRNLQEGWDMQTVELGGVINPFYTIMDSTNRKRVMVKFPDGRTEVFEASIDAAGVNSYSLFGDLPENGVFLQAVTGGKVIFKPVNGALGKLEVANGGEFYCFGNEGPKDINIDGGEPTEFRYTEEDGTSYLISTTLGLKELTDRQGNKVTIQEDGIYHSAGENVLFTRDAANGNRITAVTDPAGNQILYGYDEQGRLASVMNRENEVTTMLYEKVAFPNYLTSILDPRGVQAIRTEYDDDGRMIKQVDADGNAIEFEHDLANNREIIRDRLGNVTIHEYDDFGNVIRTTDALGGVTTRAYDAQDNEISVTTPEGVTTSRTFDSKRNVTSETDGLGNVTSYSFNDSSQPTTIVDALGQATTFGYNAATGNLTALTDAVGTTTSFGYSGSNLASLTDANGVVTSFTHDSLGREQGMTVKDAAGNVLRSESYTYDDNGNRLTTTTSRTKQDGTVETLVTSFTYDAENRVRVTTLPDGSTTEVIYNSFGKQQKTIDQLQRETLYEYDDRGNLVKTTYHDNTFSTTTYDLENRSVASTNRMGVTTYFVYDALGRMTATILPDDSMPASVLDSVADILASSALADNPRTVTEYDADGRVVASIDALGNRTEFEYDAAGRRTLVRDALGKETLTTYNAVGSQVSVTDALNRTTSFVYDDANRLVQTVFPDASTTSVSYDSLGRRQSVTDQEGNVTSFEYDDLGRMVAVVDAEGFRTEYDYNERGDLLVQRDALGRETKYNYDSLGRRIGRTLPEGQSESVAYNVLGNMTSRTDFNGHTTTYTYNSRDLLEAVTADTSHPSLVLAHAPAKFEYGYDSVGRRISATVKGSSNNVLYQDGWSYDLRGRLSQHSSSNGTLDYSYDVNSNLLSAHSNRAGGYDQSYSYDVLNRLEKLYQGRDAGRTEIAGYSYNAVGSLANVSYQNGIGHEYFYNSLNRLTGLDVAKNGVAAVQQGYAYTLNKAGHRTKIEEASGRVIDHVFDKLYRLKQESIAGSLDGRNGSIDYVLDAVGNRTSRTASTASLLELLPDQSFSYTNNDLLSHHSYDANGSTTSSPQADYPLAKDEDGATRAGTNGDIYDFRGKLLRRNRGDGSYVDCHYNADGDRIRKEITDDLGIKVKDDIYLIDRNTHTGYAQVVEEVDVNGLLTARYHYGHDLVAVDRKASAGASATRDFYSYDGHGSVRAITDEYGDLLEEYDYDAFGIMLAFRQWDAGTGMMEDRNVADYAYLSKNRYLYTGEQYDADLGMYYLRARYTNTQTGRFHSMDSYEGRRGEPMTLHKYLYTHANPVSGVDPSGNVTLRQVGAGISALLTLHSVYTAAVNPTWINIGFAAFDVATLGAGKYLSGLGKALFGLRVGSKASKYEKAIRGGKKAIEVYRFKLRGTVLGLYPEITAVIKKAAQGVFQANHINQVAAFTAIPKHLGLAIPLAGSAKKVGTEHWRFHKYMDDFWDGYRRTTKQPTEFEYHIALYNALVYAGQYHNDAKVLAHAAIDQAKHFGYFIGKVRIKIPNRTTAATR